MPDVTTGGFSATRPSAPSRRRRRVTTVQLGDRVLISCITSCGTLPLLPRGPLRAVPAGGGWVLGHTIDGTQAEYVRVPFADLSVYPVPTVSPLRGGPHAGRHLPPVLRSRCPERRCPAGDCRRGRGAGPIGLPRSPARACLSRAASSRSTSPAAGSRQPASSAQTSTANGGARTPWWSGPDRRSGRRRHDRSRRRPGHL